MDKFIGNLISNPWVSFGLVIGAVGGLIADAIGINNTYVWVLLFMGLFITFGVYQEHKKEKLYKKPFLPIPIVINVSNPASSENALNQILKEIEKQGYENHLENLKKYFSIEKEDLIFEYKGDIYDKERLIDFLKILKHDIEKLEKKIPQGDQFYLAYIGPASVAFLVGIVFSSDAVKIFQYDKSINGYIPVLDVKDRKIKENVEKIEKFEIEKVKNENLKRCVLAIDISTHKIRVEDLKDWGDIILMKSKNKSGTLSYDDEWERYIREIFKVMNELQQQYDEIILVYSIPVAIAIGVGITIQNYWHVLLTNYEKGEYKPLIYTDEIKFYF